MEYLLVESIRRHYDVPDTKPPANTASWQRAAKQHGDLELCSLFAIIFDNTTGCLSSNLYSFLYLTEPNVSVHTYIYTFTMETGVRGLHSNGRDSLSHNSFHGNGSYPLPKLFP